jgi:hypothetical protein
MKATIADIKALAHRSTTVEDGIHKEVYVSPIQYNSGENNMRLWRIGEDLLDFTGKKLGVSEFADFDLWPAPEGTIIVVSVAITEEGRKAMTEALEAC